MESCLAGIRITTIQELVAVSSDIALIDMTSRRHQRRVARPRQVAMYLSRMLTRQSFPAIGRSFGNRDHTTVMHAMDRVTSLMALDPVFRAHVAALRLSLETADAG